jgi:hypothetical protein
MQQVQNFIGLNTIRKTELEAAALTKKSLDFVANIYKICDKNEA